MEKEGASRKELEKHLDKKLQKIREEKSENARASNSGKIDGDGINAPSKA
jgi:hypothetical protein